MSIFLPGGGVPFPGCFPSGFPDWGPAVADLGVDDGAAEGWAPIRGAAAGCGTDWVRGGGGAVRQRRPGRCAWAGRLVATSRRIANGAQTRGRTGFSHRFSEAGRSFLPNRLPTVMVVSWKPVHQIAPYALKKNRRRRRTASPEIHRRDAPHHSRERHSTGPPGSLPILMSSPNVGPPSALFIAATVSRALRIFSMFLASSFLSRRSARASP